MTFSQSAAEILAKRDTYQYSGSDEENHKLAMAELVALHNKEVLEAIPDKYRKVTGGYRLKGEPGIATNFSYVEGFNEAIRLMRASLAELAKEKDLK